MGNLIGSKQADVKLKTIIAEAHNQIRLGHRDEAEALYKQAVEVAKQDIENPTLLYLVLLDLEVFYQEGAKLEEAEQIQILAREAQRKMRCIIVDHD